MALFKHILVPLDFEGSSMRALGLASELALALGAKPT